MLSLWIYFVSEFKVDFFIIRFLECYIIAYVLH